MSFWRASGSLRAVRGGSGFSVPRNAQVALRNYDAPGDRDYDIGLRLVRRCT